MKRFSELSDEEILEMDEIDTERMIKSELLEEGLEVPSKPKEPIQNNIPAGTIKAFRIEGFEYLVLEQKVAESLSRAIKAAALQFKDSSYKRNSSYRYLQPLYGSSGREVGDLSIKFFYDEAILPQVEDLARENEELRAKYESDLRIWSDRHLKNDQLVRSIKNKITETVDKYKHLDEMVDRIKDFLRIADGNHIIAARFFINSFGYDKVVAEYIYAKTHIVIPEPQKESSAQLDKPMEDC